MATISKHGKGWRVQIRRLGHTPLSKTFPLKAQAYIWADKTEREILEGRFVESSHTLKEALDEFAKYVAPKRKGARWEILRIEVFKRSKIASKPLSKLSNGDVASWRDERLLEVSGASVRRELSLLGSVLDSAREWKWLSHDPLKGLKKPPASKSRQRGVRTEEITALREKLIGPASREVFLGFELAIETAMRAGEMWSLGPDQVDLDLGVAHLSKTKNGDSRDIPLSPRAIEILKEIHCRFKVSPGSRDALFRKARNAAGISDLHFHDSRSEGITRLSKKLDILELARVVGHRDPRSLMHYYRADAAAIAKRLASPGNTPSHPPQTTSDSAPES